MPFEFKRLQFHIRLAFSMTINKAQDQSLQVCRLNPEKSMICIWTIICLHIREWEIPQKYSFLPKAEKQKKNIVYAKALE